jgi:hypothetical protein
LRLALAQSGSSMRLVFNTCLACHIVTGTIGLVAFWVPLVGAKGSAAHRKWGVAFVVALIATGLSAIGMSLSTLISPFETHPHITDLHILTGLLGWMMLYLAVLTITMGYYGYAVVMNRRAHDQNRHWLNLALQGATLITAVICAWVGARARDPLMLGISTIGLAAGITNLQFILRPQANAAAYVSQHVKAIVGAGASIYTAFISVGLVRYVPQEAFNPVIWGLPAATGTMLIMYHQYRIQHGWNWRTALAASRAKSPASRTVER